MKPGHLLLATMAACAFPVAAQAKSHVIGTFPIAAAKALNIDGCGAAFARFEDFRPAPDHSLAFVFVNDFQTGVVRIDERNVIVKVTNDDTHAKPATARFASGDGKVVVEESYSEIGTAGDELAYTMGIATFIVDGERQSLPVRGGVGC